jgi:hypothetical protein
VHLAASAEPRAFSADPAQWCEHARSIVTQGPSAAVYGGGDACRSSYDAGGWRQAASDDLIHWLIMNEKHY